jgi:hypothetical protein
MGSFWASGIERSLSSGETTGKGGGHGGRGYISGRAGITILPVSWHTIFGMKSKLNTVFADGINVLGK